METLHDVIIVGAGPAGSTAAAALAQQGWDVLLLERDEFPRHKVCGEFLSPEAQATLRALKVHEAVVAAAPVPLTAATVTTQRGQTIQMPLPGLAWGVSRFALDTTLAGAAQCNGVTLCTGATVQSYTQTGDYYVVHWQKRPQGAAKPQPMSVAGRALMVACGRHSATALPPHPTPHKRPLAVGIKCHYIDVAMPAQVELFFFPGGYAGINPVEGGRANLCLLLSYAAFRRAGQSVPATLAAIGAWNPALGRRLLGGHVLTETITTVAPVDTGNPAAPWADVACLGDTAVMLPPLCGDGMAMALRSAELCVPLAAAFLRGELTLADWAAAYQRHWHEEFDQRVRTGRRLQRLLSLPVLADALVGLGRLAPPLATYFVNATRGSLPVQDRVQQPSAGRGQKQLA